MTITAVQAILLGLCCGVAKLCIPYTFGAILFNTVIGNAVIVGLVLGDLPLAMSVGASLQLIYLGVIAAGGNQPSDPCLASYVAIPFAMASGLDTTAAVALAVPVGLLGAQIVNVVYLLNGFFAQRGDAFVEKGDAAGMVRWSLIYPAVVRVLFFAVPIAFSVYFGSSALDGVLNNIPDWVSNGLTAMGATLPAVGFAIIASLISRPAYIPFFFASFFLVEYTGVATIPLLLIGAFMTFLYMTFTKRDYISDEDEDDDDDDDDEDDTPVERVLTKFDVTKAWLIWWFTAEIGHSFERMQGPGFCAAVASALKKIYPRYKDEQKEQYVEALKRNDTFFNTNADWGGGPILGLTLALEEKKAQDDSLPGDVILDLKTSLMGPLAGIGDTISWSTLMYLFIGMFLPLANDGNALGGIAPVMILTIICFVVGLTLTQRCYTYGYSFAEKLLSSGLFKMVIAIASILGLFMMGGLAATYVTVSTPLAFATEAYSTTLQSILDSILPGILPLAAVLGVWGYLAKIKRNYFAATIGLSIISFVLGAIGVLI